MLEKLDLKNWPLMRIIRVAGGSFLLINGIIDKEYVFVGVGLFILIQGIFNIGCSSGNCANNSCSTTEKKDDKV